MRPHANTLTTHQLAYCKDVPACIILMWRLIFNLKTVNIQAIRTIIIKDLELMADKRKSVNIYAHDGSCQLNVQ